MQAPAFPELLKDSEAQRRTMVDCQIRTFGVTDRRLIARVLEVPRELFVPDTVRALAYSDIGFVWPKDRPEQEGRYILPPLVLVRMIQDARLQPQDRVLDVAPGGGYSTAIIAGLVSEVVALEADAASREQLAARLAAFGLTSVKTNAGPLDDGASPNDSYDVILINGEVQANLERLFARLNEGGRLVAIKREAMDPTGRAAKAVCFEKHAESISPRYLFDASAPCLRDFQAVPQFVL